MQTTVDYASSTNAKSNSIHQAAMEMFDWYDLDYSFDETKVVIFQDSTHPPLPDSRKEIVHVVTSRLINIIDLQVSISLAFVRH